MAFVFSVLVPPHTNYNLIEPILSSPKNLLRCYTSNLPVLLQSLLLPDFDECNLMSYQTFADLLFLLVYYVVAKTARYIYLIKFSATRSLYGFASCWVTKIRRRITIVVVIQFSISYSFCWRYLSFFIMASNGEYFFEMKRQFYFTLSNKLNNYPTARRIILQL